MAGIQNSILFGGGVKIVPSSATDISNMQQTSTSISDINFTGDPNGSVSANPGSICRDPVGGTIYIKATGVGDVGWNLIPSGTGVPLTFDADAGSATPSANTLTISGGTTGLTTTAAGSTVDLTGILDLANGGTSADLTASDGGIFYSTATAGAILAGTATANQMLQSGASTTPAWSTATYPATTTANQILYSSALNTVTGLATANNGVLITSAAGVPSILPDGTTGQVLTATTGAPPSWASPATSGTVTSVSVVTANGFAGTVATATTTPAITIETTATGVLSGNGTAISGSPVTQFDILVGGASNAVSSVGPGTAGQILQSGGAAANPAYSTSTYPTTNAANTLLYASAANTMAALATADNGVLITSATGVPSWLADGTTGQVLTATTGAPPTWVSPSGGGFVWHDVTGGSATLAAQNGYIADAGTLTTFTMPTNNAIGDTIKIVGKGAGGWTIVYGAGQFILFGNQTTTTTTGDLASTNANDSLELICTTASATAPIFTVVSSIGNIGWA